MTADKELTDEEIIEKVRTSNQDLYAVIIDRYQKKLIRFAYNLIKNEERAADTVQESFIKAFINLNSFNIKKKFSSWIYRIVHNQAINLAKKYQKETPLLENWEYKRKCNESNTSW